MEGGTLTDLDYAQQVNWMWVGYNHDSSFTMTGESDAYVWAFVNGLHGHGITVIGPDAGLHTNHFQIGKDDGAGTGGGAMHIYGVLDVNEIWYEGTGMATLYEGGVVNIIGTQSEVTLPHLQAESGKTLNFDTTTVSGWTIITCVPEPMSALLMLCGLPLLRRRYSA